MGKKLFVGNLPFSAQESDLNSLFAAHGAVESVKIIQDKMTGRSKGYGFVEMADDAGASAAIEKLNGQEFQGRALNVNEARPQEDRPPRSGGGGGRGGFGGGGGGGRGGFGGGGGGRGGREGGGGGRGGREGGGGDRGGSGGGGGGRVRW